MFGRTEADPPITIIDFQTARLGPPGVDLAYFLGAAMSTEDRRASERDLVKEYRDRVVASGVTGFDADQCWRSYREGSLYGVFLFVGMAGQVEPSERADRLIAEQIGRYASMALDLDAPAAAGLTNSRTSA